MNESNILEALKAIQQHCIEQTENCGKCLFYGRDYSGSPCCIFMWTIHEGTTPADWNLKQLETRA